MKLRTMTHKMCFHNIKYAFSLILSSVSLFGWTGSSVAGEFDCLIEPKQIVDIRPSTPGIVDKIWVDRGDRVHTGQVLVTLDSGLEEASVELAKYRSTMEGSIRASESRVEFAAIKHNRREELYTQKFVSAQERDEAAAERRLAEAELIEARDNRRVAELETRRASEQLRLRTVKSPFNGVVVDRMMHPGELADTSDSRKVILKLADITSLYVEALLPIEAYGKIESGQTLEVVPEALGGTYKAKVRIVDKTMDAASGTFGVRLEIPNEDLKLPAGIRCKLTVPNANVRASGLATFEKLVSRKQPTVVTGTH